MDRILSIFYFLFPLCLFVFLSQIFISSFPLRISSPLCYSVVQGVVSSPFISSSFFSVLLLSGILLSGILLSGGARRCGRNWLEFESKTWEEESWRGRPSLWNLPPYDSSQLIATTTTEALILTTTFDSGAHFTTTKVTSLFSLCI